MKVAEKYKKDITFVKRCLEHDGDAWSQLLAEYKPLCMNIAHKYHCSNEFDDVFSEFIIQLLGSLSGKLGALENYKGKSSLKTYLLSIFRYTVINYLKNKKQHLLITDSEKTIDEYEGDNLSPSFLAEYSELEKILSKAITSLPEIEQKIVDFYYYHQFSLRQISKILPISVPTITNKTLILIY